MNWMKTVRASTWWRSATIYQDRHYPPEAGISLADHLEAVAGNLMGLLGVDAAPAEAAKRYSEELRQSVLAQGLSVERVARLLHPVALLHDIGKTADDPDETIEHPLTGVPRPKRHPLVSLCAAAELLPQDLIDRSAILALIELHDEPYAWYRQFRRSGQMASPKAWRRLDRKIDPEQEGRGLVLLAIFRLVDTDGHDDLADVLWFINGANQNLLDRLGRSLPVPTLEEVAALDRLRSDRPD